MLGRFIGEGVSKYMKISTKHDVGELLSRERWVMKNKILSVVPPQGVGNKLSDEIHAGVIEF